ncbi:MAG: hypothetical protein AAF653_15500, partial [Chloroflexota bacterium]
MLRHFALLLLLLGTAVPFTRAADVATTTAHSRVTLYSGPGHTYTPAGILNPGLDIHIVERNTTGNWVRVQRLEADDEIAQDGWLMLGYLNIPDELRFSEVPVTAHPDADTDNISSRSMRQLYSVPVIPAISERVLEIYEQGQVFDRDPNAITKIGDSLSADRFYLQVLGAEQRVLGPYDYLSETVDFYSQNTEGSVAAQKGLSTLVVFDPFWARSDSCEPNESPLECEYRLSNPSVAFIMFGPNDVLTMNYERYGENMRKITEETIALGIIPVLSTFSYHPDHEQWWPSVEFNLQVVEIAEEFDVPLINLWAASRPLDEYGLDR